MILFLARGGSELAAQRRIARDQRLRRIERLRAHFARVIHAHQAGDMALLLARKLRFDEVPARRRTRASRDACNRAQRTIEGGNHGGEHRVILIASDHAFVDRGAQNRLAGKYR